LTTQRIKLLIGVQAEVTDGLTGQEYIYEADEFYTLQEFESTAQLRDYLRPLAEVDVLYALDNQARYGLAEGYQAIEEENAAGEDQDA
jgi:hypothetical protein